MARILISAPEMEGSLDSLAGHELVAGAPGSDGGAQALICPPTVPVREPDLARMPALAVIAVAGAGLDAVDVEAAARRGVAVLSAGEALVETTADLAFGLIIASCRLMSDTEASLREGAWQGWRFDQTFGRDVSGAALGLLGFGRIARAVARRAAGFSMSVLHHTRHPTGEEGWTGELDELLSRSEILSIHVPLTDATRGLLDARRIAMLPRGAVLVNTARGPVVEEDALIDALVSGRLLAAGLDVYDDEPNVSQALLAAPRTVLLPHIGSATERTRRAMLALAAQKVAGFLAARGAGH